uniref:VWFA domain-containing protein n=2 Tax=Caenorhabditis tropicalis TaxID=1561998 RepID=A0A1I7TLG4_9PELO
MMPLTQFNGESESKQKEMLARVLLVTLLAVTGVNCTCNCYTPNNQMLTGSKIVLSNAFDDSNFSSCYAGTCGFIAYSGDPTKGWSNINVKFGSILDNTGVFKIYNGNTSDPNLLMNTYGFANSQQNMSLTSSTPYIYIAYSQDDSTKPNSYYGTITAGGPLAAPTTTAAPTSPTPTRAYNNSLYPRDPYQISHDILVIVNQRTDQGAHGLSATNQLASKFVGVLSNTTEIPPGIDSTSKVRLGLVTVTPYNPFYSAQGEIWKMTSGDVQSALPQSGISINVEVVSALKNVVPTFFNVNDPIAPTRKTVQRSVILFTAWWGDNTQVLDDVDNTVKKIYDQYGVNLAIIGFNTTSNQLVSNSWYNYASLTNSTDNDVAQFVNRYYFNSNLGNSLINNWCAKSADPVPTDGGATFTEPSNYGGPTTSSAVTSWDPNFDGQTKRYCNFQDTTYTYTRKNSVFVLKITVFYELEIEQDYLKFYADGVEIESFTGVDVNNAVFNANATVITARFTTNNAIVQRGFSVKIEEVAPA